jgi:hypothetical protein
MSEKSNELSENDKVTQTSQEEVKGIKEVNENQEDSSLSSSQDQESSETVASSSDSAPIEEKAGSEDENRNNNIEVEDKSSEIEQTQASSETDSPVNSDPDASDSDNQEEDETEDEGIDLSDLSKIQLLKLLKEKVQTDNLLKIDKLVHEIKDAFEELENKDKEEALAKFKEQGGVEDDFEYRHHDEEREFHKIISDFRHQLYSLRKEAEKQKEKNLEAKNVLLNKLRDLVDGEETTLSMNAIKVIQDEWKSIGPVPSSQNRNLWASYNALMDRYYDNRSIYFELKELDRKKNLESKQELCEKAEALKDVKDLKDAIKQLNELHEEFKHIGPVPRAEQEELWQRFKAASDTIYDRRKIFFESQKEVYKVNQIQKEELIAKLNEYSNFSADRIKDWNSKTKEILEIQKEWEKIGPVPREAGREINKAFWGSFKHFFHNKNLFFKQLDEVRASNLNKAEELITQAESLMENTDWQSTANQLINLQKEWKKLGPTPEKHRDALYKRFKTACDTFFDNRRNSNKQANSEFDANLKQKQEVITKILAAADGSELSEDALTEMVTEFNEIGFVPRKNIKEIQNQFKDSVEKYLEKLNPTGENKEDFLFRLNLNKIQNDPNAVKTFNKKEHGIRKQISDLENNITLWKNNLEFFAASKTADKLKDQFDVKIQKAEEEVEKLKKKLSILREF